MGIPIFSYAICYLDFCLAVYLIPIEIFQSLGIACLLLADKLYGTDDITNKFCFEKAVASGCRSEKDFPLVA